MEVKLFSIKSEDKIYYVPATNYGQAVEKYKEAMAEQENRGQEGNTRFTADDMADPEKVTIVCDEDHLIMPANYDIDS